MNVEKKRQLEAQLKIQDLLRNAEEERRQKRMEHCIREFILGKQELLYNDEFAASLPEHLPGIDNEENKDHALKILDALAEAVVTDNSALRQRAVMILSLKTDRVITASHDESIRAFAGVLVSWLVRENEFIPGYEVLCRQLQEICTVLLQGGHWQDAIYLLATLQEIQAGTCKKKNSIRSVIRRTLENIARPEILGRVYERLLVEQGEQVTNLEKILIYLGTPSVLYGLQILENNDNGDVRQRLIHLLASAGRTAARVLEERMQHDLPGEVTCDLIRILCAMEDDAVYPLIRENLLHPDLRVQRESIECILRFGGENMILRLTDALQHVDDSLKIVILKKLANLENVIIRDALLLLLDEIILQKEFANNELLASLIIALQRYPDTKNLIQLREFKGYLQEHGCVRKVLYLIDETIILLEAEMRHRNHRKNDGDNVTFAEDPVIARQAQKNTREIEQEVIALLGEGQAELAAEKLFTTCVDAAREKDFPTAERLRDRILGVHPGAVALVIEAEEVITQERESKIPASHLELWKGLQNGIGVKEYEELYLASEQEQYPADEIIAREGERDDRLYFIDSGTVSLSCTTGSSATFLKRLQAGAVVGLDQFFNISVWTVTVKALTPVVLRTLKRTTLHELEGRFPGLEENLHEYCEGTNYVPDLLKMSGGDRRTSVRCQVSTIIRTFRMDSYGAAGHLPFAGQLQDISSGGFCYIINIDNSENARSLLGRQVQFELELEDSSLFAIEGFIVGLERDETRRGRYRVHVKLLEDLSSDEIGKIVAALRC